MAHTATHTPERGLHANTIIAAIRNGFAHFASLGDRTPKGRALNALARTSDAELTARGTSRELETRRIIGAGFYI